MSFIGGDPFGEESKPSSEPPTLIVGLFIAVLFICMPVWSAITLLTDEIVSYFIIWWPLIVILICGALMLVLFAFFLCFLWCGGHRVHSGQPSLNILALFVMLYAALIVAMSYPLSEQAYTIKQEVRYSCGGGRHTHLLYDEYLRLSQLRSDPDCMTSTSVSDCDGFNPTKEGTMLEKFESELSCSGYCSQFIGLDLSLAPVPFAFGDTWQLGNPRQSYAIYPPTLFSQNNWTASCSGMSMRNVVAYLGDISDETFWEGVVLFLIISIAGCVALTNIISLSGSRTRLQDKGGSYGYGAISGPNAMRSEPMPSTIL